MSAITKFISALTPSDIVQILGIIASFLTAIVAIIISLVTLRQNSKMLEESSRAVISVYSQSINTGTPMLFLVVKILVILLLPSVNLIMILTLPIAIVFVRIEII